MLILAGERRKEVTSLITGGESRASEGNLRGGGQQEIEELLREDAPEGEKERIMKDSKKVFRRKSSLIFEKKTTTHQESLFFRKKLLFFPREKGGESVRGKGVVRERQSPAGKNRKEPSIYTLRRGGGREEVFVECSDQKKKKEGTRAQSWGNGAPLLARRKEVRIAPIV